MTLRIRIIRHPRSPLTRRDLHTDRWRERCIVVGRVAVRVVFVRWVTRTSVRLERRGVCLGLRLLGIILLVRVITRSSRIGRSRISVRVRQDLFVVRVKSERRGGAEIATAQSHVVVLVCRSRVGGHVHVGAVGQGAFL